MSKITNLVKLISVGVRNEYHHIAVKPLNALAYLTYRCTSRCKTCNIWKRAKDNSGEISKEDWLAVLTKLKSSGIKSFEIYGGDALLRKDAIFDVIQFCSNNGIHTHFPTNGNLCDKGTVKNLIRSGLYTVYLSIDDVGSEHDTIRGVDGTFNRVREALEMFLNMRGTNKYPMIVVCTTLSNMNYRNFYELVEFLERYNIDAIYPRIVGEFKSDNINDSIIDGITPEPNYASSDEQSHLFGKEELEELRKDINKIKSINYKTYIDFRPLIVAKDKSFLYGDYDFRKCHIATTLITVTPNGDVTPCPFYPSYKIGNLLSHNLNGIWGNSRHKKFIRLQQNKQISICKNCNLRIYYPSIWDTFHWEWRKVLNFSI